MKSEYRHLEQVRDLIEACFRCGDCRMAIRPDVGRFLVCPVYEAIPEKWESFFARGRILLANGLLRNEIEPSQSMADMIFQCTICGSCKAVCNQSYNPFLKHPIAEIMDQTKIWEALRSELSDRGFLIPRHAEILNGCNQNHNPYFEDHQKRTNWVQGEKSFPDEAEYLFFMGCTEAYRNPDILRKIFTILDVVNLNYTILKDEWCCGSIALRIGDHKLADQLLNHNWTAFQKSKSTKIITHCAGCYRTLKKDYPELLPDFNLEVLHITELIQELIMNKRLILENRIDTTITYHDPCHLGRHMNLYDAPRFILNSIPGLKYVEMKRNKENAWCCGSGAGVKSGFQDLAVSIAKTRIDEAIESGANILATSCPFCLNNLNDAVQKFELGQKIEVIDVLDLLLRSIKK